MDRIKLITLVILLLLLTGCQKPPAPAPSSATPTPQPSATPSPVTVSKDGIIATPSGLRYQDLEVGTGPRPLFNQSLVVRYTGWLKDGMKVDSNVGPGQEPFIFKLGSGSVIRGWELGIGGGKGIEPMRVGSKRKLIIPPELGYGDRVMGVIPPNSTLVFEIELVGVRSVNGLGFR